jgi:hypothetical protein
MPERFGIQLLNGLPAFVVTYAHSSHQEPPRAVISGTIDASGQIASLFTVVADRKLTHVRF